MVSASEDCVLGVDSASGWEEVGSKVPDSKYFRDYCGLCGMPIRVPKDRIGKFNACSFCQPAYRGVPGVSLYEQEWWLEQLNQAELI